MHGAPTTRWFNKGSRPRGADQAGNVEHAPANSQGVLLRKVLVVDDEPDLADFSAVLLRARGLQVAVAHSAEAALQILANDNEIDAVFSDIVMPGMTGLELADTVREMFPKVKIVLASGYTTPEHLTTRERPYLFATKPYKIDTILKLLRS